jgi:hypothetical protein
LINQAIINAVVEVAKQAEQCNELAAAALLYTVAGALLAGDGEQMFLYLKPFQEQSLRSVQARLAGARN